MVEIKMTTASNPIAHTFTGLVKASPTLIETNQLSPRPDSIDTFDTLTNLLDPLKKASVLEKIKTLEDKKTHLDIIVELVNSRNYQSHSKFFLSSTFEYYALSAVLEQRITPVQFGTLMFVRSGLSEKINIEDMRVVPLFDKGAPATDAWNYINGTLTIKWNEQVSEPVIDKNELAQFFEIMRTMPTSEQSFVLIPDTRDPFVPGKNINISYNVNFQQRFNAFCGLEINGKRMRMIPSFGMVQALLDATGTDDFRLKPVIGESTPESLRLSILNENAREMCIHCPEIAPAPNEADGSPAPALDFMYHDIYHIWVCRYVAKKHRQFFCELAATVNPDNFPSRAAKQAAEHLYLTLLDLDFVSYYRPDIWNRPVDIEKASFKALEFALGHFVEARKNTFPSKEILTSEEQRESRTVFLQLTNKLKGLFVIWKLYKTNYNNFEEITNYFDQLDSKLQQHFGEDFLKLKNLQEGWFPPLITPEECASLKLDEFGEVVKFVESRFHNLRNIIGKGVSFKTIWEIPPKKREILMLKYWELGELMECGIPFQSIAELDFELLEFALGQLNYISIVSWKKRGIEFKKITALLRVFIEQKLGESVYFNSLETVMTSDRTLVEFLKLNPSTHRLIFNNVNCVTDLIKCGVPSEKVINCDPSQLEAIFTYITDHRLDKSYKWVEVAEMMKQDPEFRKTIEELGGSSN